MAETAAGPLAGARILVTGAAGFIGFHCATALLDAGAIVTGLDDLNPYYDPALKRARLARLAPRNGFDFVEIDLAQHDAVVALVARMKPDYVLHLAAQAGVRWSLSNPRAYLKSNMDGFLSILEACRATPPRHLVYASSSSVYGLNATLPFSEHAGADHPLSLYAATKRANELMAHTYAHLYRTPLTGLRFFTVYGPWGRPDMAYWKFTRDILAGTPIELYDATAMSRDFTHVDDVVQAILRLLPLPAAADPAFDARRPDPARSSAPFRVFNIGNHAPVALMEFVELLEAACGRSARIIHRPRQPGDAPATFAAVEDLAALTGFAPRTRLADGLAGFVAWFREHHGR
jgi:UDP-glucuronate 4-epimerase